MPVTGVVDVRAVPRSTRSSQFSQDVLRDVQHVAYESNHCAEPLPEHGHRRLISDALVLRGVRVMYLLDVTTLREHVLSAEARRESSALIYDRDSNRRLDLQ